MDVARELVRQAGDDSGMAGEGRNCIADGYPIIERVVEVPAQLAFL